jgi:hypothetical protein
MNVTYYDPHVLSTEFFQRWPDFRLAIPRM